MPSISMKLETLIEISTDGRSNSGHAELGNLVVSWAGHAHLAICLRKEAMRSVGVDHTLSLLWMHQLQSLDEWGDIQIAINKYGNICFLYRLPDAAEPHLEQIREVIRSIQLTIESAGLQYKI